LLKIRNPWGIVNPVEWNQRWSDGTTELMENEARIKECFKKNAEERARRKGEGMAELEEYNDTADGTF